jgi:hypothetical protein
LVHKNKSNWKSTPSESLNFSGSINHLNTTKSEVICHFLTGSLSGPLITDI